MNSLGIPRPTDPIYSPYAYFTQTDFFSPCVEKVAPQKVVHAQGLTMPQVAAALSCWACVGLEVVHANQTSPSQFVAHAKEILSTPDTINGTLPSTILLNYLHSGVGEVGGGHFSPVAAYDDASDRFLVLDVARYKYPAVWVPSATLFDAMATVDSTSGLFRGYLVLRRSGLAECSHPLQGVHPQQQPVRISVANTALHNRSEDDLDLCPSGV